MRPSFLRLRAVVLIVVLIVVVVVVLRRRAVRRRLLFSRTIPMIFSPFRRKIIAFRITLKWLQAKCQSPSSTGP